MRYCRFLYSFWVILPVVFFYAASCAVATFIENDYGSNAARAIVYNSWWFELLHVFLLCALIASFIHSKAWQRKKYASLLLHFSFIVIILGAGITRFFGTEGMISIAQGQTNYHYDSSENFINIAGLDSNWQKDYAFVPADISVYGTLFRKPKIQAHTTLFGKPLVLESRDIALLKESVQKGRDAQMILTLDVTYNGETQEIQLIGGDGTSHAYQPLRVEIGGLKMSFHWGSKQVELPFGLRLIEFQKETYAGSDSPSSYASEVEVRDKDDKVLFPFRIYMNHVLDYKGFRFYQSNYYPNEAGTAYISVLSVNNDPGKLPTYIGYTLLVLGALWVLFDKKGRFMSLAAFLKSQKVAGFALGIIALGALSVSGAYAESNIETHGAKSTKTIPLDSDTKSQETAQSTDGVHNPHRENPHQADESSMDMAIPTDEILKRLELLKKNSREFSERLSRIQVQDWQGRIQPLDTIAMNIVHKIYKKDGFNGLNNTQVIMGLMVFPNDWTTIKLISTATPALREVLGVDKKQKYVSWLDVYNFNSGESKLRNYIADISQIPQSQYGNFEKDVLNVNERYEIIKSVQNFLFFKVFPDPKTQRWFSFSELAELAMMGEIPKEDYDRLMTAVKPITLFLLYGINKGVLENSWDDGLKALQALENYQKQNGGENYLSESRVKWEIWLNHYNVFEVLTFPYVFLGLLGFIIVLVYILKDKAIPKNLYVGFYALIVLCVLLHTFGLALRWYVAGHSPWSNAYESMLYIAWASGIAGVVFFRKYVLALCAASFLSGVSLFVAHLGFMDPQIQNLVPVLKSYWLNIHVSVITASYGFLGLCFILGVFSLFLFILRKEGRANIDRAIYSVSAINEMSMILGLLMLTIGNFLGAVWANESWGRYWGWDPKETWALISIGIYAIVLHLRFIGFKNMPYVFNVASVLAFYSILMTYFGVNYYLSGKHSYAAGDPVPVPTFLYVFIALTILLIVVSKFKSNLKKVF